MENSLGWEGKVNPYKLNWLKEILPTEHKEKVLDLGAGKGWYSQFLLSKGAEVTAFDQKREVFHPEIDFFEGSLEKKLPFGDQFFSFILALDIIEHIDNEGQILSEIHRVLRPGGKIFVSVPHGNDTRIASSYLTYAHYKDKTHKREYTPVTLKEVFAKNGFSTDKIELMGGHTYPYVVCNFIDNAVIRKLTRLYLGVLKKLGLLSLKDCHGDIFAIFTKNK